MEDEDIFGAAPVAQEAEAPPVVVSDPEPVVDPAPEPVDEQVETPPAIEPAKPEPGYVPLAALLDERDRKKQLEAELARYQAQQTPPEPVDVYDPEAMAAWQQSQVLNTKLELSEDMTRDKFGDELVDKARDWALQRFQQNPAYQQEVLRQRNPWKYVVDQYQRDQIASQVDLTEYEQFKAWKAAQATLAQQPAPVAAQTPPSQPPRSLASAPSAGNTTQPKPAPEVEKLNDMFGAT